MIILESIYCGYPHEYTLNIVKLELFTYITLNINYYFYY